MTQKPTLNCPIHGLQQTWWITCVHQSAIVGGHKLQKPRGPIVGFAVCPACDAHGADDPPVESLRHVCEPCALRKYPIRGAGN